MRSRSSTLSALAAVAMIASSEFHSPLLTSAMPRTKRTTSPTYDAERMAAAQAKRDRRAARNLVNSDRDATALQERDERLAWSQRMKETT